MPKLILIFFGEAFIIDKPKNLQSLRKQISKIFSLSPSDVEEILLTYREKAHKIIISNEQDLIEFLNSKNNIIELEINPKSQLYQKNLDKLKEEKNKDKTILEELFQKKEELQKLKETKFDKEKKEIKELEDKINELQKIKRAKKKMISKEIEQIEKEIKDIDEKIEKINKKLKNNPNQKLKINKIDFKENYKLKNAQTLRAQNLMEDIPNSWEISDEKEATGAYSDWRNQAIINPTKGQLIASGYVNVKFKSLKEAKKYDIYFDYQIIKTFEQDNANDYFEFEVRNNEVKKHTVCIVATLEDGTEVISNMRNFFISKKGIGIWQSQVDQIKEMNISWYYDWSVTPLTGVTEQAEYVPMIWGNATENSGGDRKKEWEFIKNYGWKNYRYLLMFNEPDFKDQANMTPEQAVENWKNIQPIVDDKKVDVSSPCVAIPTVFYEDENNDYNTVGGWFGKFNKLMKEKNYSDEFTAVHFYFDYPGDWILDIFKRIHEYTGKKLWITEWGVAQWSQVQDFDWVGGPDEGNWQREIVEKFVKEILPILDKTDYIERYAWFPFDGSNTEKFGNGAGGLFYNTESDSLYKQLTSVGKAYKEFGNPEGWKPNSTTEDQVIKSIGKNTDNTKQNVLSGKKATASSEIGVNAASNAIDSNLNTRWESQHGKDSPEWIMIDLIDTYIVEGFKVIWESAAAKEYKIQVSTDGSQWIDVYNVTDGKSAETKEDSFSPVKAKYIRLYATSKTMEQYGYSIYDFQVIGVKDTQINYFNIIPINLLMKNNTQNNTIHSGVKCISCGALPIKGLRYKCVICNNFNYCEKCKKNLSKEHKHPFYIFFDSRKRPICSNFI